MTVEEVKKSLEALENDFKNIPDREKDFPSLQDRLEVLLRQVLEIPEIDAQKKVAQATGNAAKALQDLTEGLKKIDSPDDKEDDEEKPDPFADKVAKYAPQGK